MIEDTVLQSWFEELLRMAKEEKLIVHSIEDESKKKAILDRIEMLYDIAELIKRVDGMISFLGVKFVKKG